MEGLMPKDQPAILFVCVQNAGRSQMAAAFAQALGGDRVVIRSAGSAPAEALHPAVVQVMAEAGLDLTAARPRALAADAVQASDVVITMGCGDSCPWYPGKRYLDWQVDDPADLDLAGVRRVRDEIRREVEALLSELGIG
jgi:protein-tyrosine-phosphatase